ncbi:MAG: hypothetical protein L6R28_14315 [Planctomycetes bacterium]|nr:hypothetical protein [Planctomycetota bacterium]
MGQPGNAAGSSSKLRWNDLVQDVFQSGIQPLDPDLEWPDPDYAAAAKRIGDDSETLDKLRQLCEDLESVVTLAPGPGSLRRVAGVPLDALRAIEGRCWRAALLDEKLSRTTLIGIRNYAAALKSRHMDACTRRAGAVIHAVAIARLEKLGEFEADAHRREKQRQECQALAQKPYLPACLAAVLA